MYIDETYQDNRPYVILSAFIVKSDNWKHINGALNALKIELFSKKDFNLKSIRRHRYEIDGYLWVDLPPAKKIYFNEKFWKLVTEKEDSIMAALINRDGMDIKNKQLNFKLAYGFLLERFQYILQNSEDTGFVIYDDAECSEEIKELYNYHRQSIENGIPIRDKEGNPKTINLSNIYENLVKDDDDTNNCLQISDMIGAAISGKYNSSRTTWFEKLKPAIRKNNNGIIEGYGIKIFPA